MDSTLQHHSVRFTVSETCYAATPAPRFSVTPPPPLSLTKLSAAPRHRCVCKTTLNLAFRMAAFLSLQRCHRLLPLPLRLLVYGRCQINWLFRLWPSTSICLTTHFLNSRTPFAAYRVAPCANLSICRQGTRLQHRIAVAWGTLPNRLRQRLQFDHDCHSALGQSIGLTLALIASAWHQSIHSFTRPAVYPLRLLNHFFYCASRRALIACQTGLSVAPVGVNCALRDESSRVWLGLMLRFLAHWASDSILQFSPILAHFVVGFSK